MLNMKILLITMVGYYLKIRIGLFLSQLDEAIEERFKEE
jgi:hypothetical protein